MKSSLKYAVVEENGYTLFKNQIVSKVLTKKILGMRKVFASWLSLGELQ